MTELTWRPRTDQKPVNDKHPLTIMYAEYKDDMRSEHARDIDRKSYSFKPPAGYFFYQVDAGATNYKKSKGIRIGPGPGGGGGGCFGGGEYEWNRDIAQIRTLARCANIAFRATFWAAKPEDLARVKHGTPGKHRVEGLDKWWAD